MSRDDAIAFYADSMRRTARWVVIAATSSPLRRANSPKKPTAPSSAATSSAPSRPQEPPPVAVRSLTLTDARVEQPTMQRAYLAPSFRHAKSGQSEALECSPIF